VGIIRRIFKPGFAQAYFGISACFVMTQINWAMRMSHDDVVMRLLLSFGMCLLIAPVLIAGAAAVLRIFPKYRERAFEIAAGFFAPLNALYLFPPFYFLPKMPIGTHRAIMYSVIGLTVVLLIGRGIYLLSTRKNEPVNMQRFLPSWVSFTINGFKRLIDKTLFSPFLFAPDRPRLLFQPLFWPFFLAQVLLIIRFKGAYTGSPLSFVIALCYAFLLPLMLVNTVHVIAGTKKWLQAFLFVLIFIPYLVASLFHFNEMMPVDFNLIAINSDLMFTKDAFHVYRARAKLMVMIAGILYILWAIALQKRHRVFTVNPQKRRSVLFPLAYAALLAIGLLTQIPVADEIILFARSIRTDVDVRARQIEARQILSSPWPYIKTGFTPTFKRSGDDQPDIFVVLLESFNQNWVETQAPNGVTVTPFFNSLIPKGLYAETFYANAMQTCRGLFSIMAGINESSGAKIFRSFKRLEVRPLPTILEERGYRTVFFNAHYDLNFDNKGPYLKKLGFGRVVAMNGSIIEDVPASKFWNWGIQDDVFYTKSFGWLDSDEQRYEGKKRPPLFAVFLSLSQHHPHNFIPKDLRKVYPDAGDHELGKGFVNAQNVADDFLRTFFHELESRPRYRDAVVILMGDHSHPSGRHHGNATMQVGISEDNFRTPFLLIWPKNVKPRRLSGTAFQQLDVAPTVLDLLGIDTPNHFVGRSMLSGGTGQTDILYSQPYSGQWLVAVRYPFKYGYSMQNKEEVLYDLASDPGEDVNLVNDPRFASQLEQGRRNVQKLKKHQMYLQLNRIWDPSVLKKAGAKD
jgi:phosphoglycerol transferase MdoB-like AlkP superfamily enzyme